MQADVLMKNFKGIENIKKAWVCFDPKHEPLSKFVSQNTLKSIADAQTMRNKLVHGVSVFKLSDCRNTANEVLNALNDLRATFEKRYGYDGWSVIKRRIKSKLHTDPRIKI